MSGIKYSWLGCGKTAVPPRQAWCSEQPGGRLGTDPPAMTLSLTFQEASLFPSSRLAHRHFQPLSPGSTESVRGCSGLRNSQAQLPMRRAEARPQETPGAEKGHSSLQRQRDPSLLSPVSFQCWRPYSLQSGSPEVRYGSVSAPRLSLLFVHWEDPGEEKQIQDRKAGPGGTAHREADGESRWWLLLFSFPNLSSWMCGRNQAPPYPHLSYHEGTG